MTSASSLRVSEIFSSVQGEGSNVGVACHFLRLGNCNLRCTYCDTKYTWDWAAFDRDKETRELTLDETALELRGARHLVVTGGEPLLQQEGLSALLAMLDAKVFVELETNGTLAPVPSLLGRVNQWNVSPKLGNAGESEARRLRYDVLERFATLGNAWLKLVIDCEARVTEARLLAERLAWPALRVMLMPEAQTRAELEEREGLVARACAAHGFRYSPRLHVQLWGVRRGI